MPTELGEAAVPIRATLDKLDADLAAARGKVEGAIEGIVSSVQTIGKVALGIGGVGIAAIAGIGTAVGKMAIDAAPVEGLENAFAGLAESAGVGMDEMLAALQRGSAGMVSQRDLMMSFNQAAQLVSLDFAEQLPDAMSYLGKVSAATGQDMGFLLDSLVKGVGRLSPMILDNLAIQVNMTEATEAWAKANNIAKTSVIDNTAAIGKEQESLEDLEQQLLLAQQKQSEFTDKTKESTRMANEFRIQDLTDKIAAHRAELSELNTMNGKTVTSTEDLTKSMTKGQQQEALMAQVLEKLAANTAAMPDVSETAAAKMAQLKTTIQDTKDQIGMAFLPVLSSLSSWLNALIPVITPLVDAFLSKLVPALDAGIEAFGGVRWLIEDLISGVFGRDYPWEDIFPPEIAAIAYQISAAVFSIIDAVAPYVEMAIQWISENVQLQDVLIALGIAIASVVVPAILSIVATVAPVIATFIGLVAIVGLLRQAWETDWMGIRTALTEFWENTAKPALQDLWAWLQVSIPAAIETLKAFWENTLLPALQTVWSWIQTSLFPVLQTLWEWLQTNIPVAIETLKTFWEKTLLPAIQAVWSWIQTSLFPVLQTLWEWLQTNIPLAIETLKTFWENTLLPAIQAVWSWIQDTLFPMLQDLWDWLEKNIPAAIETLKSFWEETLLPAIQAVWAWIQDNLVPLFEAIDELLGVTLSKTLEALAGLWQNVLQPALEAVWAFIQDSVIPVVTDLADKISTALQPVLEWLGDFLTNTLKAAFDGVSTAIKSVTEWVKDLAGKIAALELPSWLKPGSPTPFELALRGISDEMQRLSDLRIPALQMSLAGAGSPTYSLGGIYGSVHLHGVQSPQGFLEQMQELSVR